MISLTRHKWLSTWAENYNPPLKLRKALVKVTNNEFKGKLEEDGTNDQQRY